MIVDAGHVVPARIERIDVTTGARTFLRHVAPPDLAGVVNVDVDQWLDREHGYVYTYARRLDSIFVVKERR